MLGQQGHWGTLKGQCSVLEIAQEVGRMQPIFDCDLDEGLPRQQTCSASRALRQRAFLNYVRKLHGPCDGVMLSCPLGFVYSVILGIGMATFKFGSEIDRSQRV